MALKTLPRPNILGLTYRNNPASAIPRPRECQGGISETFLLVALPGEFFHDLVMQFCHPVGRIEMPWVDKD